MSRASWRKRGSDAIRPDVVVRCKGQRILQVMPGEPAPLEVAMPAKTFDQYVLVGESVRMRMSESRPLVIGGIDLNAPSAVHYVTCPTHPNGHGVSGARLRHFVELARGSRKTRSVDASDVS